MDPWGESTGRCSCEYSSRTHLFVSGVTEDVLNLLITIFVNSCRQCRLISAFWLSGLLEVKYYSSCRETFGVVTDYGKLHGDITHTCCKRIHAGSFTSISSKDWGGETVELRVIGMCALVQILFVRFGPVYLRGLMMVDPVYVQDQSRHLVN